MAKEDFLDSEMNILVRISGCRDLTLHGGVDVAREEVVLAMTSMSVDRVCTFCGGGEGCPRAVRLRCTRCGIEKQMAHLARTTSHLTKAREDSVGGAAPMRLVVRSTMS